MQVLPQPFTGTLFLLQCPWLRAGECLQRMVVGQLVKKFQHREAYQDEDQ